jgi:polyphosphate kinase 2 (PPK2 family)
VPSDREKSQLYFQRFVPHFPAAGEVAIFDRSWYNRAGIEYVMGFCSKAEHDGVAFDLYFAREAAVHGIVTAEGARWSRQARGH